MFEQPSRETISPPYIPPPAEASTPALWFPPAPKRRAWPWVAGLAVFVAAIVGVAAVALITTGDEPKAAAAVASATAPAVSAETRVECVNVGRAYRAWNTDRVPSTLLKVDQLNEFTVKWSLDDGKEFLAAVSGWEDQPAKALAAAVASYNMALALVNLTLTVSGETEIADANEVVTSAAAIHAAYRSFEEQC